MLEVVAIDDIDDDSILGELLLTTDDDEDADEMIELLELVTLELELEVTVVLIHLMLSKLPLLSVYSYWEQGFELMILTLFTYAVNGALVKSVYPPIQLTVSGWPSGSPAHQTPR
jgi:hypothetical protein